MAINLNPGQFRLPDSKTTPTPTRTDKSAEPEKALTESLAKTMPGVVSVGEKQSPQETARNILQHVQNGLNQLRVQGADAGRLEQRLQAAREGIEKGYAEATDMLKGLGMLDDNLKGDIAAGRELVNQGLDELAGNIRNPQPAPVLTARSDSLNVANAFSLEVLTREGDRVTVSFEQSQSLSQSRSAAGESMAISSQRSWNMEVAGSLSEAERTALTGLFDDVQSLSERFFAGDIGRALGDAMELGFDGAQLASMSLNLVQQTSVVSTRAYSQFQPQLPTPELESLKAPLASYVDSYLRALDKASPLANAAQTLQDLVQQMLPEESRLPVWQAFHHGINQLLSGAPAAETAAKE